MKQKPKSRGLGIPVPWWRVGCQVWLERLVGGCHLQSVASHPVYEMP